MTISRTWSQENYVRALKFATEAHGDQKVPGSDLPYVVHVTCACMEVMAALAEESGRDGDLAVQCALLHDVIEDTGTTYEQVEAEFGKGVADGVLALSKDKTIDPSKQMKDSLRRIQDQPHEVWIVKLADRITNLAAPPHYWSKEKIIQYREEAVEIHDALKNGSPFLTGRLREKIENYNQYAV